MPTRNFDRKFIKRSGLQLWYKEFPNTAGNMLVHCVASALPLVEISDDSYALGIRGPDRKIDSLHTVDRVQMGAKSLVTVPVRPFLKQMNIVFSDHRLECIGIMHGRRFARFVSDTELVRSYSRPRHLFRLSPALVTNRLVKPGRVYFPHHPGSTMRLVDKPDLLSIG